MKNANDTNRNQTHDLPSCTVVQCIEREGKINSWLVFEVLKIVENFIQITYTLYVDLIETLNSQLIYNFS
jgi:hypothetical protein